MSAPFCKPAAPVPADRRDETAIPEPSELIDQDWRTAFE